MQSSKMTDEGQRRQAVSVGVVLFWSGGRLPFYAVEWCSSIAPQSHVATAWLFVDQIKNIGVPNECFSDAIRIVQLGPHGVARRLASSILEATHTTGLSLEALSAQLSAAIAETPKLLIELKPVWLWAARNELLQANHTHATSTDMDVVFGDLARWLHPRLVWPYDVTTWAFEGDSYRIFLRGQWTLFRLRGDGSDDLAKRFTRCSYLSSRLSLWLERRKYLLGGASGSALQPIVWPDANPPEGSGHCAVHDSSTRLLSAEGCYSCAIFTGLPVLRVVVRPVMFSDHTLTPVWWAFGALARLSAQRCQDANPPANLPEWDRSAWTEPECHGRKVKQWLTQLHRSRPTLHEILPNGVLNIPNSSAPTYSRLGRLGTSLELVQGSANCSHLKFKWLQQCPGALRCLHPKYQGIALGAILVTGQTVVEALDDTLVGDGTHPNAGYVPCVEQGTKVLDQGGRGSLDDVLWPFQTALNTSAPRPRVAAMKVLDKCKTVREAPVFHFRVWDHADVLNSSSGVISVCSLREGDEFRVRFQRAARSISVGEGRARWDGCDAHIRELSEEWLWKTPEGYRRLCVGYGRDRDAACGEGLQCAVPKPFSKPGPPTPPVQVLDWAANSPGAPRRGGCTSPYGCVGLPERQAIAVREAQLLIVNGSWDRWRPVCHEQPSIFHDLVGLELSARSPSNERGVRSHLQAIAVGSAKFRYWMQRAKTEIHFGLKQFTTFRLR